MSLREFVLLIEDGTVEVPREGWPLAGDLLTADECRGLASALLRVADLAPRGRDQLLIKVGGASHTLTPVEVLFLGGVA